MTWRYWLVVQVASCMHVERSECDLPSSIEANLVIRKRILKCMYFYIRITNWCGLGLGLIATRPRTWILKANT